MAQQAPRRVKVVRDDEAAIGRKWKPKEKEEYGDQYEYWNFKPKKRQSDGPASRAVRVYYLRASATDNEVKQLFEPFGFMRYYRRSQDKQTAYMIFDNVSQARAAKNKLEHSKPDVVLRRAAADGYYAHHAYSGMKIDFIPEAVADPSTTPTLATMWSGGAQ